MPWSVTESLPCDTTLGKMSSINPPPPPKKKKNKPPSAYKPNNYKIFVVQRCAETRTPIHLGYVKFKNEWEVKSADNERFLYSLRNFAVNML